MPDNNNQSDNNDFDKLRKEVLDWIERNERKKNIKSPVASISNKIQSRKTHVIDLERKVMAGDLKQKNVKIPPSPTQPISYKKARLPRIELRKIFKGILLSFSNIFIFTKKISSSLKINQNIFIKPALIIFGLIIFLFLYGILGVYFLGSRNSVVSGISKVLALPAMKMYDQKISYHNFLKELKVVEKLNSSALESIVWMEKNDTSFNNTIRYLSISRKAKNQNIILNNDQISLNLYQFEIMTSNDIRRNLAIKDANISQDEIRKYIIEPQAYVEIFFNSYKNSNAQWKKSQDVSKKVLSDVRSGSMSFTDAALSYSEHPSAQFGGDIGFFKKGILPIKVEDKAFSMNPGELSDIIETLEGFYIIQVTDVFHEIGMVKANIIFIKNNVDIMQMIDNFKEEGKMKVFIPKK